MGLLAMLAGLCTAAIAADPPTPVADIRFRDFFSSPIGPRGLQFNPSLLAVNGQRVRLTGYMVAQESALAGHFLLSLLQVRMSEHANGDADDLPPATAPGNCRAVSTRNRLAEDECTSPILNNRRTEGMSDDPIDTAAKWHSGMSVGNPLLTCALTTTGKRQADEDDPGSDGTWQR